MDNWTLRPVRKTDNASAERPSVPTEETRRNIIEADIDPVGRDPRSSRDQLTECLCHRRWVQGPNGLDLNKCGRSGCTGEGHRHIGLEECHHVGLWLAGLLGQHG